MDIELTRPILSGVAGGIIASFFCLLLRRWVPEVCDGKDTQILMWENRVAVRAANALFLSGIVVGIALYELGFFPRSDWRGLALGAGGGSLAALLVLGLLPMMKGDRPKEAYVAFAIAQKTPSILLYLILMLTVAAFAAAAGSLLVNPR